MRTPNILTVAVSLLAFLLGACMPPTATQEALDPQDTVATWVAASLTAQAVSASAPSATPVPIAEETPTPTPTATEALPISTPQNPLVLETTLCWKGPGAQYVVVSALKKDERVELIGRGSLPGWWIVDNPIYHDPCWAQAEDLQIEPGYDTSGLKIYNPPPTPRPPDTPTP